MTHAMKKGALEGLIGLVVSFAAGSLVGLVAAAWQLMTARAHLVGAQWAAVAGAGFALAFFGGIQGVVYLLDRRPMFAGRFFATHVLLPGLAGSQVVYWAIIGLFVGVLRLAN